MADRALGPPPCETPLAESCANHEDSGDEARYGRGICGEKQHRAIVLASDAPGVGPDADVNCGFPVIKGAREIADQGPGFVLSRTLYVDNGGCLHHRSGGTWPDSVQGGRYGRFRRTDSGCVR